MLTGLEKKFRSLTEVINRFRKDEYFNKLSDENKKAINEIICGLIFNADNKDYKLDDLFAKFKEGLKLDFNEFEKRLKEYLNEIQGILCDLFDNGVKFELKSVKGEIVLTAALGTTILGSIALGYFSGPLFLIFLPALVISFGLSLKSLLQQLKENWEVRKTFGSVLLDESHIETQEKKINDDLEITKASEVEISGINNFIPSPPKDIPVSPPNIPSVSSDKNNKDLKTKEADLENHIKNMKKLTAPEYFTDEQKKKWESMSITDRADFELEIKKQNLKSTYWQKTAKELAAKNEKRYENKVPMPKNISEEDRQKWDSLNWNGRMDLIVKYSSISSTETNYDPNNVPMPENISEEDKQKWDSMTWYERNVVWCKCNGEYADPGPFFKPKKEGEKNSL